MKLSKVHAHSFRHLFSKEFLKINNNNVLALADFLGHTSLETVWIYCRQGIDEQRESLKNMYK